MNNGQKSKAVNADLSVNDKDHRRLSQPEPQGDGGSRREGESTKNPRKRASFCSSESSPDAKKSRKEDGSGVVTEERLDEMNKDGNGGIEAGMNEMGEDRAGGTAARTDQMGENALDGCAEDQANERGRGQFEGPSTRADCCINVKMRGLRNLECVQEDDCQIHPNDKYFEVLGKMSGEVVCKRHKKSYETVHAHESPIFSEEKKLQPSQEEKRLKCEQCGSHHHPTCSMYHPAVHGKTFCCNQCVPKKRYDVTELKTDSTSELIEEQLGDAIQKYRYLCRTLSATRKNGKMDERFPNLSKVPSAPYIQKIIGVFEEIDGSYVLVFLMIVQEYKDVPSKKSNTVHLQFLDKVDLVKRELPGRRGARKPSLGRVVFQAYCSYAAGEGFETIHFHASPPERNQDYLFNCHPLTQKYLDQGKLVIWYDVSAKDCKAVEDVEHGLMFEEDDTLDDILDRNCYEHGYFPSEMEMQLADTKELDEKERLKKIKDYFNNIDGSLFFIKLKKPAELTKPSKMTEPEEVGFSSSFVTEDFLKIQRLNSLEFHTLDSAKLATRTIVGLLVSERQGLLLNVVLPQKAEENKGPQVVSSTGVCRNSSSPSSAENKDLPQSSQPVAQIDGTSKQKESILTLGPHNQHNCTIMADHQHMLIDSNNPNPRQDNPLFQGDHIGVNPSSNHPDMNEEAPVIEMEEVVEHAPEEDDEAMDWEAAIAEEVEEVQENAAVPIENGVEKEATLFQVPAPSIGLPPAGQGAAKHSPLVIQDEPTEDGLQNAVNMPIEEDAQDPPAPNQDEAAAQTPSPAPTPGSTPTPMPPSAPARKRKYSQPVPMNDRVLISNNLSDVTIAPKKARRNSDLLGAAAISPPSPIAPPAGQNSPSPSPIPLPPVLISSSPAPMLLAPVQVVPASSLLPLAPANVASTVGQTSPAPSPITPAPPAKKIPRRRRVPILSQKQKDIRKELDRMKIEASRRTKTQREARDGRAKARNEAKKLSEQKAARDNRANRREKAKVLWAAKEEEKKKNKKKKN